MKYLLCLLALFTTPCFAQTLHIKDMSWVEIKGLVNCGYTNIIVPTGGLEQNGSHMVLAKHDYIVGYAAEKIANELGNTLVAPVVSFVPQGEFNPPSGNMQFAGTIGVQQQTFEMLLDNIARSLKNAGFKRIVFIGDHGPSQASQVKIAARLSDEWRYEGIKLVSIASYYDDKAQYEWLKSKGESLATIGIHAGLIDTSELMFVHVDSVSLAHVPESQTETSILGGSGTPQRASVVLGETLLNMRIAAAVKEIKELNKKP